MARDSYASWSERGICGTDTRFARTLGVLDLAPLANIVLLLAIFALIANGFVFKTGVEMEVKTHLPALGSPSVLRGRVLTLTVTAEEFVYVDDPTRPPTEQARPLVVREALTALVADFARRHPDGTVLINADVNTRHGCLMRLLDVIRDAGISQVAFGGVPQPRDMPTHPPPSPMPDGAQIPANLDR